LNYVASAASVCNIGVESAAIVCHIGVDTCLVGDDLIVLLCIYTFYIHVIWLLRQGGEAIRALFMKPNQLPDHLLSWAFTRLATPNLGHMLAAYDVEQWEKKVSVDKALVYFYWYKANHVTRPAALDIFLMMHEVYPTG
jgi:hypothetical protein